MKQTATVPNVTCIGSIAASYGYSPSMFLTQLVLNRNGPCMPCHHLNILASPLIAKSLPVQVAVAVLSCTSPAAVSVCTINPVQISVI